MPTEEQKTLTSARLHRSNNDHELSSQNMLESTNKANIQLQQ